MGMFQGMRDAAMSGGGNNIKDGRYKVLIEKCIAKKGYKGSSFIAELRVMEAEAVNEYEIGRDQKSVTDKLVKPNAVNSKMSYTINLKFDNSLGNIKKFVLGTLAALGYTEDMIDEELIDKVVGPKQPLAGMAVAVSTYRTVNQGRANKANEGNILVLCNFDPIDQTPEDIKAQRAWLANNAAGAGEPEKKPDAKPAPSAPVKTTVIEQTQAAAPAPQTPSEDASPLAELGL